MTKNRLSFAGSQTLLTSENENNFFVNRCICNKVKLIFLTFYGHRKLVGSVAKVLLFSVLSLPPIKWVTELLYE